MMDFEKPLIGKIGKKTIFILRSLGYCLLFLFLLDFAALLAPPKFTNANWELNLFGQVIERIPLLLLCFPLIFFGESSERKKWEKLGTKVVSWLTLVIAVTLILGIPLTVINTFRVQGLQQADLIANVTKQTAPIQEVSDRLSKAESDSEIRDVLKVLNPQQKSSIDQIPDPKEVKKKLLDEMTNAITKSQADLETQKIKISLYLWKNSVKWIIAAIVSAIFLLYVWKQSKHTNKKNSNRNKSAI